MVVWYTFEGDTGIFFHLFPLLSHLFLWVRYFFVASCCWCCCYRSWAHNSSTITLRSQVAHAEKERERAEIWGIFFFCVGPISATGQTSHRPHFTNSPFCWTKSLLFPTMRVSEGMDNSNNNRGHEIIESGVRFFSLSLFWLTTWEPAAKSSRAELRRTGGWDF